MPEMRLKKVEKAMSDLPDEIKETRTEDGLRLMLRFYRNMGQLSTVSKQTGVPIDTLKRFIDGEDCLTPKQDEVLRKPLMEFGSKKVKITVDLKKVKR